jgi:hypothetical protein
MVWRDLETPYKQCPKTEAFEPLPPLESAMGVCQGVAMDSFKFHPGPSCPTLLRSAYRPHLKRPCGLMAVSGVACPQGGRPAAVFYPFGQLSSNAYGKCALNKSPRFGARAIQSVPRDADARNKAARRSFAASLLMDRNCKSCISNQLFVRQLSSERHLCETVVICETIARKGDFLQTAPDRIIS